MMLPAGQGAKVFTIMRPIPGISAAGRPGVSKYETLGTLKGYISTATQKEIEQWKQNGHPITNTIVQPIPKKKTTGKPTDILVLHDRAFLIQGQNDPGELGQFMVYYCQEREDLKWITKQAVSSE